MTLSPHSYRGDRPLQNPDFQIHETRLRNDVERLALDAQRRVDLVGRVELVHVGARSSVHVRRDCTKDVLEAATARKGDGERAARKGLEFASRVAVKGHSLLDNLTCGWRTEVVSVPHKCMSLKVTRQGAPVTLLFGLMNTSTPSVTVFMGVRRCSRSSIAMNSGGARPVAIAAGEAGQSKCGRTGGAAKTHRPQKDRSSCSGSRSDGRPRLGCIGRSTHLTVMPSSMTLGPTARHVPSTPCFEAA